MQDPSRLSWCSSSLEVAEDCPSDIKESHHVVLTVARAAPVLALAMVGLIPGWLMGRYWQILGFIRLHFR